MSTQYMVFCVKKKKFKKEIGGFCFDRFFGGVCRCVICMLDFVYGDPVRFLPCMHIYHMDCIDDWLMRSFTCPSCMEPVDAALLSTYETNWRARPPLSPSARLTRDSSGWGLKNDNNQVGCHLALQEKWFSTLSPPRPQTRIYFGLRC